MRAAAVVVLFLTNQKKRKEKKKQLAKRKKKKKRRNVPDGIQICGCSKVQVALLPFKFLYTVHSSLVPLRIYNYLILIIHIYFRIKNTIRFRWKRKRAAFKEIGRTVRDYIGCRTFRRLKAFSKNRGIRKDWSSTLVPCRPREFKATASSRAMYSALCSHTGMPGWTVTQSQPIQDDFMGGGVKVS